MSDSDKKRRGGVVIQRAVVRDGRVVEADSPEAAALVEQQMQQARARDERRRELWGVDNTEQIVRLARSFPTLRDAGGLDPWDAVQFLDWALSPACTSGSWHASMFVLSVWNQSTDWSVIARREGWLRPAEKVYDVRATALDFGLVENEDQVRDLDPKVVDRAEHAVHCSRQFTFQVANALAVWDEEHRAAFLTWCQLPFWP